MPKAELSTLPEPELSTLLRHNVVAGAISGQRPTTAFYLRASLLNGRLESTTAPVGLGRRCWPQIPFRRKRIGCRIQKIQKCVHQTCKVTDRQIAAARNSTLPCGTDGKPEYIRAGIDCVQFLDDRLEIGKGLNALGPEFLLPLQGAHDLAHELRQPGHRMGRVNREGVGLGV